MKIFLQLIWVVILFIATFISYYGAWQHNLFLMIIGWMPYLLNLGFKIGKDLR